MSPRQRIAAATVSFLGLLLLTLIGLHFYLRWQTARFRTSLVNKGEKLNIEEIARPHLVSDDNGAPQLQIAASQLPQAGVRYSRLLSENPPIAMRLLSSGRAIVGWKQPDWRGYSSQSRTNTWEELRTELEQIAPVLADVHFALKKPAFDFRLNYSLGGRLPLPHLASLRTTMQILNSATLLHLHDQNLALALESLRGEIALVRVLEDEPLTMSQFARSTLVRSALAATWEALQADGWNDSQLADLQERWHSLRFLGPSVASATMDRAMRIHDIHWIQQSAQNHDAFMSSLLPGQSLPGAFNLSSDPVEAMYQLPGQTAKSFIVSVNTWWWRYFSSYNDERRNLAFSQAAIEALRIAITNRSYGTFRNNMRAELARRGYPDPDVEQGLGWCGYRLSLHHFFAEAANDSSRLCTPVFQAEVQRELVVAAIALKRYQLSYRQSPRELAALVPEFLRSIPCDYMDGELLRFKNVPDSTSLLYSVGVDSIDDGGNSSPPGTPSDSPTRRWLQGRDWVWPQPASREEIEKYNVELAKRK